MSLAVARERLDVFFFPSVYSYFPLLRRSPVLVGVHDTMAEDHPHFAFASRAQERYWRAKVRLALWQADRCLTVSQHAARSIQRVYGIPPSRLDVVPEAAAAVFQPSNESREDFILYAGGISPNKNLLTLVEAFASLTRRTTATRLVLVGDYLGDRFQSSYEDLRSRIAELGLEQRVEFTGRVSDEDLASLYRRAKLFAMPSFDEGFGLPAIEAMACGAPVVVSTGNALEELVGEAGLEVAPKDAVGLRDAMDRILADDGFAAGLSAKGLARARQFSWDETARGVLAALQRTRAGK